MSKTQTKRNNATIDNTRQIQNTWPNTDKQRHIDNQTNGSTLAKKTKQKQIGCTLDNKKQTYTTIDNTYTTIDKHSQTYTNIHKHRQQ